MAGIKGSGDERFCGASLVRRHSGRLSAPFKKEESPSSEISAIPFDEPITFWKANETLWVFCLFTVNVAFFFSASLTLPFGRGISRRPGVSASFYSVRFPSFDSEQPASSSCLLFFFFRIPSVEIFGGSRALCEDKVVTFARRTRALRALRFFHNRKVNFWVRLTFRRLWSFHSKRAAPFYFDE